MKKKIGDLTLFEHKAICDKATKCGGCPLYRFDVNCPTTNDEELNVEIELDELET